MSIFHFHVFSKLQELNIHIRKIKETFGEFRSYKSRKNLNPGKWMEQYRFMFPRIERIIESPPIVRRIKESRIPHRISERPSEQFNRIQNEFNKVLFEQVDKNVQLAAENRELKRKLQELEQNYVRSNEN